MLSIVLSNILLSIVNDPLIFYGLFISLKKQDIGKIRQNNKEPVTKNGSLNPPASYKNDPNIGPASIPSPVNVYVNPIKLAIFSG